MSLISVGPHVHNDYFSRPLIALSCEVRACVLRALACFYVCAPVCLCVCVLAVFGLCPGFLPPAGSWAPRPSGFGGGFGFSGSGLGLGGRLAVGGLVYGSPSSIMPDSV